MTSLPSLLPQINVSPISNPPTQSFTELQSTISETLPISMEFFSASQTFTYNPINFEDGQQVELSDGIPGMNMEQFMVWPENQVEDMGVDTDDPILHS